MPNKTTQHDAELKINSLFYELGLLEPYGKLDNPNYVTPYEKTVKILTEALAQQQQEDYQEVLDLDIMKDEPVPLNPDWDMKKRKQESRAFCTNQLREELRQAIEEKRRKE